MSRWKESNKVIWVHVRKAQPRASPPPISGALSLFGPQVRVEFPPTFSHCSDLIEALTLLEIDSSIVIINYTFNLFDIVITWQKYNYKFNLLFTYIIAYEEFITLSFQVNNWSTYFEVILIIL